MGGYAARRWSCAMSRHSDDKFGRGITVEDSAEIACVSPKTIHRHRHEMLYRRIGRRIIISEKSLQRWLERNTYGRESR